jgi:hypothetical protein
MTAIEVRLDPSPAVTGVFRDLALLQMRAAWDAGNG